MVPPYEASTFPPPLFSLNLLPREQVLSSSHCLALSTQPRQRAFYYSTQDKMSSNGFSYNGHGTNNQVRSTCPAPLY